MHDTRPKPRPTSAATNPPSFHAVAYGPDPLSPRQAAAGIIASMLGGGLFALAAWCALHSITLPAFNTSMTTRALATACAFVPITICAILLCAWLHDDIHRVPHPRIRRFITEVATSLTPACLVVAGLGVPLSATRLYLDGIQVDQGFRTQFLSRMALQLGNHDMNYADLPTFYPLGWFWLGGRMANLLDLPGWAVYQPWAIVSLAAAASALTPLWRKLTGSLPVATAIAAITTAIVLTQTPDEPYAAIVAMFVPAAAVLARSALGGSWPSTLGLMFYLGVSANFYTLYTAISALTVIGVAVVITVLTAEWRTVVGHLLVIGVGSALLALVSWGPYLSQIFFGAAAYESTANHFLPQAGTVFPLPFFSLSLTGALCMIGLVFLFFRVQDANYGALVVAIGVSYLWALVSMASTLLGTSLLGFRLEVVITLLFATTGVLALAEIPMLGLGMFRSRTSSNAGEKAFMLTMTIIVGAAALAIVQDIPKENESHIDQAYADTDGFGERADRYPADAGQYYGEITDFLAEHGRVPGEAVVYTDEINFMAFYPFFGFNAFTSHYANPLGEFRARTDAVKEWAEGSFNGLSDPAAFIAALDDAPWRAPEAFIFRGDMETPDRPYKTHVAHDIFPSEPNVRYEAVYFNPEAFASPAWDVRQIGPFVVAVRTQSDGK